MTMDYQARRVRVFRSDGAAPAVRRWWSLSLVLIMPLLLAGSCPPKIEDFVALPPAVCEGDTVTLRLAFSDLEGQGLITARPVPAAGPATVSVGASADLRAMDTQYQICEATTFDVKLFNGTEAACGTGETICDRAFANLLVEPHVEEMSKLPCDGAPGTAIFEVAGVSTLVVDTVTNCGTRSVEVLTRDGSVVTLLPGATSDPSSPLSGQNLAGRWTARSSLRSGEGCPRPADLRPRPDPPAPPGICLRFEASCPDSDVCG